MIIGGLLGWLVSAFLPPIYEATAVVTTNLSIAPDGNVTEIMVDAEIDHVGELVFHPAVIEGVIEAEAQLGNPLNLEDLTTASSIERRLMNTLIKVRNADPTVAARIATSWAEVFFATLTDAYPHAVLVSDAQLRLDMLENCLTSERAMATNFCLDLNSSGADAIRAEANAVIVAESPASLGLTRYLNVSALQEAAVPAKPDAHRASTMVLAGAFIGLIGAIIFIETRKETA